MIVRIIVLFEAFKVFTTLGGLLVASGLIYGVGLALVRGQGFPTLAGTMMISGILTFFMGIVADQVVELRKERFEEDYAPIDRTRRSTDGVDDLPAAMTGFRGEVVEAVEHRDD